VAVAAEGFEPPGPADFELPAIAAGVTKPMVLLVLSAVLVLGFFVLASRKQAMVPGRLQYAGEQAYGFVRNDIARDIIGSRDFMRFVPYLVSLFFFVLINNLYGIIPLLQFPTFSRSGYAYGLAALTWLLYNGVASPGTDSADISSTSRCRAG
jgi:F-type H+-transporting ATPase subunit a